MSEQDEAVLSVPDRLAFYRTAAGVADTDNQNYHGLRIHAAAGLHDAVAAIAVSEFPKGCDVIDIASGSGAMCMRLGQAGFNLTACDGVEENFRLSGQVPFLPVDLNTRFASGLGRQFDAITATEIIEHLENPRQFLRECFAALKPGGKLILSTPNLETALSKAMYIRSGTAKWYTDRDYMDYGHITPMPLWVLRKSLLEAGFAITRVTSEGSDEGPWFRWWKMHLLAFLIRRLDVASSPQGDILILVAEKPLA